MSWQEIEKIEKMRKFSAEETPDEILDCKVFNPEIDMDDVRNEYKWF